MKRAFGLALLVACHAAPPVVRAPGDTPIESVRIEGNHVVSSAVLVDGLATHRLEAAKEPPDPYMVAMDVERIRGMYLRHGYLDIDVTSRVDGTVVTFAVREGERARTRIEISGLPPEVTADAVRAELHLTDGAPFDDHELELSKPALIGIVQDAGYARAQLDEKLVADRARKEVAIVLAYTRGPKCTFGPVRVDGADGLRDAVLARVKFAEGETYSSAAVDETREAIYALSYFTMVRVAPEPGDGPVVTVRIELAEGARHEVKLGGGFGADPVTFEARARASYAIRKDLDTLTLDARPAYALLRDGTGYEPRMRAIARLDRQDFLATNVHGSAEVGYDYLTVEAYTSYGPRAALGIMAQVGPFQLRAGWAIEGIAFRDFNPLVTPDLAHHLGIDHFERVGAFQQTLIADFRDNRIEPLEGAYAEVRASEGTAYAGGAYSFFEVAPEVRGYVPVGPVVIAARARFGAIFGDVPPTERFFSGGATSNRGFAERQLSPFVAGNGISVPYGGAAMIDTGLEARFPIWHVRTMPLGGVAFVDGGDDTDTVGDLDLRRLCWSAGFGLRLLTIIGPARVDFGYRLNRVGSLDPQPGSDYAVHLSLGEAF